MHDTALPIEGFDDFDPMTTAALICHVELDVKGGRTPREVAATTAAHLRTIAAGIEAGLYDTGHHPFTGKDGVEVGTVYVDFYSEG